MMKKAATEYVPHANDINEEARKKLRVTRLHQSTCTETLNQNILTDKNAGEWAKHQTLKQIQMVRDLKKR
jgi:hypothetical protein